MDKLSPELCQKVFNDLVERPYIPLSYMLKYEPYRMALFHLNYYECSVPKTLKQVRTWITDPDTFHHFKRELISIVELYHIDINLEAINETDWIRFVTTNDRIVYEKFDWLRGGTFESKSKSDIYSYQIDQMFN